MSLDAQTVQILYDIANKLRVHSIESTNYSNSGHPSSCASIAEIMSVLFFHTMRYTVKDPRNPANDRFVLSKGHAAPILYAAWAEAGLFPVSEMKNLRKLDSKFDGHPTPSLEFIDVATGSLGQGLSCAAGMAYTAKHFDKADYRVYCICGDGESAEGSIWEAMAFASFNKLDNLVNIIDVNRLGQSDPTMYQHDMESYRRKVEAFGWKAIVVDGHDINQIVAAFEEANRTKDQPTCLLAKTLKGKNIPEVEDLLNWHGKPLGKKTEELAAAVLNLIKGDKTKLACELVKIEQPKFKLDKLDIKDIKLAHAPNYKLGDEVATRLAYGNALVNLGKNNKQIIALDGDVKNSTYSIKFKEAYPDRFVEAFIAEQNLVGVAIGCGTRYRTIPFVSTFGAFFARAYDQIRMGAISMSNVTFSGSHVGCSIGEDGPSQMALEDLAMFRAIPKCVVFYPSDAVSTERAVELAANYKDMCYIRTSRPNTAVLYASDEIFEIGKAKVVKKSGGDFVTVVAGGVTLHEALKAAGESGDKAIRVVDVFTVKPLDWHTIAASANETGNRVIVVEDHYEEGGIGEALFSALAKHTPDTQYHLRHLFVKSIPKSGSPTELMAKFKIDAQAIIEAVQSF